MFIDVVEGELSHMEKMSPTAHFATLEAKPRKDFRKTNFLLLSHIFKFTPNLEKP